MLQRIFCAFYMDSGFDFIEKCKKLKGILQN